MNLIQRLQKFGKTLRGDPVAIQRFGEVSRDLLVAVLEQAQVEEQHAERDFMAKQQARNADQVRRARFALMKLLYPAGSLIQRAVREYPSPAPGVDQPPPVVLEGFDVAAMRRLFEDSEHVFSGGPRKVESVRKRYADLGGEEE